MVPGAFIGFFVAAGTAAGTLIGLLVVAITLRPESVRGDQADPAVRAVAKRVQAFQLCRKAASLAETSARNIGWRSIDGEYRLAGTSRPSASAIARTWCGPAPQQMPM